MINVDYRTLFDAIDHGFCIIELLFDEHNRPVDYRFLEINATFEAQTGLKDAVGKTMRSLRPDHEAHWFDIYGDIALSARPVRFEKPAEALGRWYDVYAFRVGAPAERRVAILFNDITKRKHDEERLALLNREIEHRGKNMLALVASMVRLTRADSLPEYREKLTGRLNALENSERILSAGQRPNAELAQLIKDEMAAYGGDSVTWGGPTVAIAPDAARCVAMTLHELATNATKYGALSVSGGHVSVKWQRRDDGRLELRWSESDGPVVVAPASQGLGSGIIATCIRDQLGGDIDYEWRPSGLVCNLVLPASSIATFAQQ
jgi:two-component sensor histidine kinase